MQKYRKYCPRCGALIRIGDVYCIRCGYSFRVRAKVWKRINLRTIIIAVVVLLIIWVGIRLLVNKPIIPAGIVDFFRNMTSSKTR